MHCKPPNSKDKNRTGARYAESFTPVRVRCYAGHRADETPLDFEQPGMPRLQIHQILERWIEPQHRFFKVAAPDHRTYLLRQDTETHQWELRIVSSLKPA